VDGHTSAPALWYSDATYEGLSWMSLVEQLERLERDWRLDHIPIKLRPAVRS
jgi:hypothetical protein